MPEDPKTTQQKVTGPTIPNVSDGLGAQTSTAQQMAEATVPTEFPAPPRALQNATSFVPPQDVKRTIGGRYQELAGLPIRATAAPLLLGRNNPKWDLFQGLYVMSAATGTGKSITMAGIVSFINMTGAAGLTAALLYVFEPDAPPYDRSLAAGGALSASESVLVTPPFSEPANFIDDLTKALTKLRGKDTSSRLVLVIDSLTDAIENYKLKERVGQGTRAGGIQPMDRRFLSVLGALAVRFNATFLGVVNPDTYPVGPQMEATVQGVGTITSPGQLTVKARGSGRTPITYTLPEQFIAMGATIMGYPAREKAATNFVHPFNLI